MQTETIVLGGGCFWCAEAVFSQLNGVLSVVPGYAGGTETHPTYEQVSEGNTGHVEVIEITYDPEIISCERILEVFFDSHDPTTLNRQGNDIGPQYRSVIFYTTPQQQAVALHYLRTIQDAYAAPVTTTIEPLVMFYPAEAYHQEYYKMHANAPYCQLVIAPKINKLTKQFPELIKPEP